MPKSSQICAATINPPIAIPHGAQTCDVSASQRNHCTMMVTAKTSASKPFSTQSAAPKTGEGPAWNASKSALVVGSHS